MISNGLIALVGLPRSGTTIISRMISDHSLVDPLMEPYQAGRMHKYAETSLARICADKKIRLDEDRFVLVKETTTSARNISLLCQLLEDARRSGVYTGLIIVLRCPFEAFLSQVQAASTQWLEKRIIPKSDKGFSSFAKVSTAGLAEVVRHARSQHVRVVSYHQFCESTESELARLMGLFPLRMEPEQLKLEKTRHRGGDPKAYSGSAIEVADRSDEVQALIAGLSDTPHKRTMLRLHALADEAPGMTSHQAIDRLAEIVIMEQ